MGCLPTDHQLSPQVPADLPMPMGSSFDDKSKKKPKPRRDLLGGSPGRVAGHPVGGARSRGGAAARPILPTRLYSGQAVTPAGASQRKTKTKLEPEPGSPEAAARDKAKSFFDDEALTSEDSAEDQEDWFPEESARVEAVAEEKAAAAVAAAATSAEAESKTFSLKKAAKIVPPSLAAAAAARSTKDGAGSDGTDSDEEEERRKMEGRVRTRGTNAAPGIAPPQMCERSGTMLDRRDAVETPLDARTKLSLGIDGMDELMAAQAKFVSSQARSTFRRMMDPL